MSDLTFKEKQLIAEVLEFDQGYIFSVLSQYEKYNKTTTRNIIFGACGIDIFNDPSYSDLSQQKCLEKIWEIESNQIAGNVLKFYETSQSEKTTSTTRKKLLHILIFFTHHY